MECPGYCGGPGADLETLSTEQLDARRRHGCDSPLASGDAQYAITCPRCDGAGCEVCRDEPFPGCKLMERCPGHYQTQNVSEALRAFGEMREHHVLPEAGGMLDQAAQFVRFTRVFGSELAKVQAESKGD